jgi:histidinol-phosphate aminotransferase
MFIQKKPFLRNIQRIRIPENRNLDDGLRLNRNEKVDIWPNDLLTRIFSEQPAHFLSVYPDSSNLYKKLSKHINIDESKILLTSGMDSGIRTLWEIMTEPGDRVGVLGPTYAMYYVYSKLFQTDLTQIEYIPETLKLDFNQLNEFIASRPIMLFIPNPNQPIEDALKQDQLAEIARQTRKNNTLLVIDEAYFMFGSETAIDLIDEFENLVVLRTFSKGFGVPSIRLGYMVSNEENMDVLAKTRFAHESNSLKNVVAEYLLDNYDIVDDYVKKVIKGRAYVKEELANLGIWSNGEVGNYLLVDLENSEKCRKIVNFLNEKDIYVKGNFSAPWDKYILITIGPEELMSRFINEMKEAKNKFL